MKFMIIMLLYTSDQVRVVESKTKGQADSHIWFQQRSGRVTISKLKNVVCTDPSQPSPFLIKSFVIQIFTSSLQ